MHGKIGRSSTDWRNKKNNFVLVFKNQNAAPEIIAEAEQRFLLTLYGYIGLKSILLNNYRCICFTKSAYKNKFNIASLLLTEAATRPFTRFSSGMELDKMQSDGDGGGGEERKID